MHKVMHKILWGFLLGFVLWAQPAMSMDSENLKHHKGRKVPVGLWYTEGREGGVELYPCGKEICGRFYWLKDAASRHVARDDQNPDPRKRSRPLCQMQFMGGFKAEEDGHFTGGWVYSPRHGEVFEAEITLIDDNTLDMRGYILTPLLGESQRWKRAKDMPTCAQN